MMGYRMFDMMEKLFPIIFILFIGLFVFMIISGIRQWSRNNKSPRLTVPAKLVNMRQKVDSNSHMTVDNAMSHGTTTWYYATFEVESGDRMEFRVSGQEYGLLAQGDIGRLTFQGTRFLGFERQ